MIINPSICQFRDDKTDPHRCTLSDGDGQPLLSILINKRGSRMQIYRQNG